MTTRQWRTVHLVTSLLTVGFIIFYTFTGLLLNHRRWFNNFLNEKLVPRRQVFANPAFLDDFIRTCQQNTHDVRKPFMIIIREGRIIDFRYDRHGIASWLIDPKKGVVTRVTKTPEEPWHALKWLHVNYRTTRAWVVVSDIIALLILLAAISGLFCRRYRRREILLLLAGGAIFFAALVLG
jgi:hypothetical protein